MSQANASGRGAIFLVGMMGAGKSTVGVRLAARLGCPFIDTDVAVEDASGRTIPEIFERDGEAVFRRLEREAIERAATAGAVVALGGGAMAQPGMPAWLKARGLVVWLRVDVDTILSRVGEGADRPLLAGLDRAGRRERIEALLAERAAAYGQAELEIEASRAPDEIAEEIAAALGVEALDSVRDGNG